MEAEARRTYPYIPARAWWNLRRQFQTSPPRGAVDAGYLSSVLRIDDRTARNILPRLRRVGLIDDGGRPTELAMAWREDERYREATEQMLNQVYPDALRDVAPPPTPDADVVRRWFARETRGGDASARQMTSFYMLLARGEPSPAEEDEPPRRPGAERPRRGERVTAQERPTRARQEPAAPPLADTNGRRQPPPAPDTPSVHIDIQVHIDPAATAEQIDQIFASMAKHLYARDEQR